MALFWFFYILLKKTMETKEDARNIAIHRQPAAIRVRIVQWHITRLWFMADLVQSDRFCGEVISGKTQFQLSMPGRVLQSRKVADI